jgi:hypothetical protein
LCRTTITPNQMLFWKTSFALHVTPMYSEKVLHKETIMCFVITYVIMDLFQHSRALKIYNIILNIHFVGYVHQDSDLHVILMHVLHFILSFECIYFWKINAWKWPYHPRCHLIRTWIHIKPPKNSWMCLLNALNIINHRLKRHILTNNNWL